ncbi:MurR/RpiR family transcriptional regulator [Lactococcus termiticola]|nr:MurR/RpiR family transcriptional regulator [Lactococcus termiticola]
MTSALISHIKSYYDNLSRADQLISDYLVAHIDEVSTMTIQEIAESSEVSTATISRFAKKIGYANFQELKLAAHSNPNDGGSSDFFSEMSPEDSFQEILVKSFNNTIASLKSTLNLLDEDCLTDAMDILLKAETCGFFGLGSSNAVALIAYHKFLRLPLKTVYHQDFHFQQMLAAKLGEQDCAFLISHTGRNKDSLRLLKILKAQGVKVIAVTSFANSALAKEADVALITTSEEVSFRPEAVTSTVSQISLMDAIFMIYGMKTSRKSEATLQEIRDVIKATRLQH